MTLAEYYNHPAVSNSKLSTLRKDTSLDDQYEYHNAYRLGALVDALLTRLHAVDFKKFTLDQYHYEREEFDLCMGLANRYRDNPFCNLFMRSCRGQAPFFNDIHFRRPIDFTLPAKCLVDQYNDALKMPLDIKTTVATSEIAFYAMMDRLDYDRAAYWYMQVLQSDSIIFIGLSKSSRFRNSGLYVIEVKKGDAIYNRGKEKAEELAYLYYMLK